MREFSKKVRRAEDPNELLSACSEAWDENRRRLDAAGYNSGPRIKATLGLDRVVISEETTGIELGTLPPRLTHTESGRVLDLSDPATLENEAEFNEWLLLAWFYLTGERRLQPELLS